MTYTNEEMAFTLEFSRNDRNIPPNSGEINGETNGRISEAELMLLSVLKKSPSMTNADLAVASRKSERTISRLLAALKNKKLIQRIGSNKTGYWKVVQYLNVSATQIEVRQVTEKENRVSNIEKYRKYFTKDYLMGPNSFRLLDELIRRSPEDVRYDRTLDLGCGYALTSLFLANETDAKYVYALDLWIPATENYVRIQDNGLEDKIIPIHGDAMDMPFAQDYFDSIISVDAYHYFGCKAGVFADKILPFVKENGQVMIAVPGLREQPQDDLKQLFETWAEGDDSQLFKTASWWENLLKAECGDRCEVKVLEADCYDIAWQEWFQSGHEFGVRDKEFLDKGLYNILNFLLIYVRKRK